MSLHEYMERLYSVFPWPEDPDTTEGFKRYQETVSAFKRVAGHEWFREFIDRKRSVRVIDLCSGTGIGGIALAKVLAGLGIKVDLTLVDLRRSALDKARRLCLKELGFEPRIIVHDVLEEMTLEEKFDIVLIWGLTTPHFSPWNWIKVLINVWQLITDDGIFIYEESDRIYALQQTGYREINPEIVEKDKVILTIHKDKDFRSGYVTRLVFNLITNEREELKVYLWDLASSAAFTWIFFSDVDFIPTRRPYTGAVIARNPRRTFDLKALFGQKPSILRQVQQKVSGNGFS